KCTVVINDTIRSWLASRSKLSFKQAFVPVINSDSQEGLLHEVEHYLTLIIEMLRVTLPVKVRIEISVHAPRDQEFCFRLWFGAVTKKPIRIVCVSAAIETYSRAVILRSTNH